MKFSIDNPFFDAMGHIADLVVLNLLFLLTCVPAFTIGTAVSAMYEVLGKMKDGTEGTLHHTYLSIFARTFRKTVKSSLILLGIGALLTFDLYFSVTQMSDRAGRLLLPVLGALMMLYLMAATWMYIPCTRENSSHWHMKTAFERSIRHFPQTLLMILVELVPVFIWQISFRWFCAFMLPVMTVIWFSLSAFLNLNIAQIGQNRQEKNYDHI